MKFQNGKLEKKEVVGCQRSKLSLVINHPKFIPHLLFQNIRLPKSRDVIRNPEVSGRKISNSFPLII